MRSQLQRRVYFVNCQLQLHSAQQLCFGFVLHLFAKNRFLQTTVKEHQNNTKPKHGMDAVWLRSCSNLFLWKFFVSLEGEVLEYSCLPLQIYDIRLKKILYALQFYIMAKNIGIIKITGKLGGLSFRDTAFGNVIQEPGGFKSDRVKNDPIYERTRQLYTEFGRCAKIASLFRQQLLPYLKLLPDPYVYNHIQKRMAAIKDCDADSPKGERTVGKGLETAAGKALLERFSFNRNLQFYFNGIASHQLDTDEGSLTISGLDPSKFHFPDRADAMGLQLILMHTNLEQSFSTVRHGDCFIILKDAPATTLTLHAEMPRADGLLVAVLFIGYCNSGDEPVWKKTKKNVLQVVGFQWYK